MTEADIKKEFDQFEDYLQKIQFEQSETDLTPELRSKRRAEADKSDFAFCKIYFAQIFDDEFNAIHRHINSAVSGIHSISGSREFGKSAFGYITKLIKPICIGGTFLLGLGLRTEELSAARADILINAMLRNKKLCYDYEINVQVKSKGYYIINNVTFITFGFRDGLRNVFDENFKRFRTIIVDDLFNRISVKSEKDNEKVYDFVNVECKGQLDRNGLLLWFFNYIIEDSPGAKFAKEFPETHFNLPALNDAGETNWPESSYWTTEELIRKRDSLSYDVWMGDWMNDPIQKGNIFDKDWLRTVRFNPGQIVATITAIDPSHGQSPSACDKGMCTMAILKDGSYDILELYSRKEDWFSVFDHVLVWSVRFPKWKVLLFENDFQQWDYAAPYYAQWCESRKKHLAIVFFDSKNSKTQTYGSDKESRIMNLVFPFQKGKIRINEDITGSVDYKIWEKSYISFNKKKPADVFDATASAFIMIGRYVNLGTFKSLAQRSNKDKLFRKLQ